MVVTGEKFIQAHDPNHTNVGFIGLRIKNESDDLTWDTSQGNEKYFLRYGSTCVASGDNFTGVAIGEDPHSGDTLNDHGTLISASFLMAANHSFKYIESGETARFYTLSGSHISKTVASTAQVGTSDLRLSKLTSKIPAIFHVYPIYSKTTDSDFDVWCVGKPRQSAYEFDLRVAKRSFDANRQGESYGRYFNPLFDTWQLRTNRYQLTPTNNTPVEVVDGQNTKTLPYTFPDVSTSGTFDIGPGRQYLLTLLTPAGSGGQVYFNWKTASGVPLTTSVETFAADGSTRREVRRTAPANAERLELEFIKNVTGTTVSNVSLRDVTLAPYSPTPTTDHCDVYDGDSGSPSLAPDGLTSTLASQVPNKGLATPKPSWGLVLVGVHRAWDKDHGVRNASEISTLVSSIKSMQTGPDHAKEVPVFWSGVYGDFNGDGNLSAADIDILTRKVNFRNNNGFCWYLDWDQNLDIEWADVVEYVEDVAIFQTKVGDLDLDGDVDINDRNTLNIYKNSGTGLSWIYGDFNGDSEVTAADEALQNANYGWSR